MTSNQTEHQENSAQHTNAINNLIRQKKENNAADTNITYSQRELKENNAQDTKKPSNRTQRKQCARLYGTNNQAELKENNARQTNITNN